MSASRHEQVKPTPFEAAPAAPQPESAATTARSHWVLPALGALVVLVLLVVFWLPGRVDPVAEPPQPAASAPTQAPAPATPAPAPASADTPAPPEASPWSDAQMAKLRKEAQAVLEELLDVQFALVERGVEQWAPEPYAEATALATAADELYRTREFEQARAGYQDSLVKLRALQDSIPAQLATQLEMAGEAIEAGDPAAAAQALDNAELIEPGNPQAQALRQRAAVLPQLVALLEEAADLEMAGDLAAATARLEEAAALDPQHRRAADEQQRVAQAWRDQRFNDAMSDGYSALDEGRFDGARKAFRRAFDLRKGSMEAASALQEVDAAETASTLARLQRSGAAHVDKEQWSQAIAVYEQALATDSTLLFASEGLARARPRAELDARLQAILDEPGRLADVGVAHDTEDLVEQARTVAQPGPRLRGQIDNLETLLRQANTPVDITLRSDLETDVIVYKVARLGRFDQQQLTLRPGTYTAVGTRNGFRDVRRQFTVEFDQRPEPVTIICTERI